MKLKIIAAIAFPLGFISAHAQAKDTAALMRMASA